MRYTRIAIVGISGSGKSVVSRTIAEKTNLPLYHMDQLFWQGSWVAVPEAEYVQEHNKLIELEQWIIEGYVDEPMAERLSRAELVLYLDYPGWLCAWRVVKRWLMHRKNARPELPKEARERLRGEFLWVVFSRAERIRLENSIAIAKPKNIIRFKTPAELSRFLKEWNVQ